MPKATPTLALRARGARAWLVWAAGALLLAGLRPGGANALEPPNAGLVLQVPQPITTEATRRVRAAVDGPLKRFQALRQRDPKNAGAFKLVLDFNPDNRDSSSEDFAACLGLEKYLLSLQREQGVRTVAFVHGRLTRHGVLPVLACGEIFLSAEARLGKVTAGDKPLDRVEQTAYEEVAGSRYPPAIVRKMYDPAVEVVEVRATNPKGPRYRDARDPKGPPADPVLGLGAGDTALYDFAQARKFGLCQQVPRNTLDAVLEACGLPRSSLSQSPERPMAWRVVASGTVNGELKEKLQRRIERARGRGANLLIVQLECGDGDAQTAYELGLFLSELNARRDKPIETVAFVTPKARNTAAFLAFGCNKIVMQAEARLGDFDGYVEKHPVLEALSHDLERVRRPGAPPPGRGGQGGVPEVDRQRREDLETKYAAARADLEGTLRKNLADVAGRQHYPVLLAEGLLSRDLGIRAVASARGESVRKFLSEEEYDADRRGERPLWRSLEVVKPAGAGRYLTLNAEKAREWGVAQEVVPGYDEVCALEGVNPGEVRLADADWLDDLADFLRDPWVSIILVMLGITCLILELKMPGVGLPGVVAAVCFVLFFWSHSQLNGQITWLAILLFMLGLLLIGLEVFVLPGFGVCGISGILLVIVSLGLVAYGHWPRTQGDLIGFGQKVGSFSLSLLGALAAAFVLARYLPSIPFANRLMLKPLDEPGEGGAEAAEAAQPEHAALLGAIGVAATPLRPAGKTRFGDEFVDVVAEGGYVLPGTRVQVIEIEGNRIVVKEV
jgi:membrane-bound ClpP family serine protease